MIIQNKAYSSGVGTYMYSGAMLPSSSGMGRSSSSGKCNGKVLNTTLGCVRCGIAPLIADDPGRVVV